VAGYSGFEAMTIHAEVVEPGSAKVSDFVPPGWWMKATVVLEDRPDLRELFHFGLRKTDMGHLYDTMPRRFRGDTRDPTMGDPYQIHTYNFLVDTGSDGTQLGTEIVKDIGLKLEDTEPAPKSVMGDGTEVPYRQVGGQLWVHHLGKWSFHRGPYSAFKVQFQVPESVFLPPAGGKELPYADSLIGQDVVDFLLTNGQMFRAKPAGGQSSPIIFDVSANSTTFRYWFGPRYEASWTPRARFPHDPSKLALERLKGRLPGQARRVRGVRRLGRGAPT
jgi:hypothetical protein